MIESLPPLMGGRYRPIRLLRRGGMGVVYEVEHARTGERFALKLLRDHTLADDLALERFRREARVSARIKSEHVVRVIDADVAPELDGAPYLVMELLEGEDLGRACGDAPQRADRVIDWLRQVANALDKAHALGIVHRDLKPENLFLARKEGGTSIVKILDFGLAKVILDGATSAASGEMLGTPLFMAPEQAELEARRVTPKADLFALGLIAHKLLTGRHYWKSQRFVQLVREMCLQPMPPPSLRGSTLGAEFDAWFGRACHRVPEERFETASAQIEGLAEALAGSGRTEHSLTGSATAVSTSPVPAVRHTGLRLALIVAGVAVAAIGALGVVRVTTPRSSPAGDAPRPAVAVVNSGAVAPPVSLPAAPASAVSSVSSPASVPSAIAAPPPAAAPRPLVTNGSAAPPAPSRRPLARDPWADQK